VDDPGPELKSRRGDGGGRTFAETFVKSQLAAGVKLPVAGKVFISVRTADRQVVDIARALLGWGSA
jgi:carbamoyl-phosphate synthase large subunit